MKQVPPVLFLTPALLEVMAACGPDPVGTHDPFEPSLSATVPPTSSMDAETTLPTEDTGTAPVDPLSWLTCTTDVEGAIAQSGSMSTYGGKDFVPLCSGEVLLPVEDEVWRVQVGIGTTDTYATGESNALAVDWANALMWVASGETALTRVDLATGTTSEHVVGADPTELLVVDDGWLLALVDSPVALSAVRFLDIDGRAVDEVRLDDVWPNALMVYDEVDQAIVFGITGYSPSGLYRYGVNAPEQKLVYKTELWNAGSNGQDLAISPDGEHIAFAAGSGNGNGYTISDYDASDFDIVHGEYDTGPYPSAVAFSPDGTRLLATDRNTVYLFDTATHLPITSWIPPLCGIGTLTKLAFSRGGTIAYAYAPCSLFDETNEGILTWRHLPP